MKLPNFIIAGGVATGTSFLSNILKDHPDVYLQKNLRPECGFFYKSWEYSKGLEYYSKKWFSEWNGEKAVGERSSLYLHGDFLQVPERIYQSLPNVKLIYCLRNPVDRAFANYRFSVLSGFETKSFEKALQMENSRFARAKGWKREIQPNLYRKRGEYSRQLLKVIKLFPRENLLFIKSEEMSQNPIGVLNEVYDFLEVPRVNFCDPGSFSSPNIKSPFVQHIFRKIYGNKLDSITEGLRHQTNSEKNHHQRLLSLNLDSQKVSIECHVSTSLAKHFLEFNKKLEDMIEMSTADWNSKYGL